MINNEIADIFDRMSRVLAFKGVDRFRVLAYQRAAFSLRDLEEDLTAMATEGRLDDIPGVGKDLAAMIEEYIKTGRIRRYNTECRGVPDTLIDLMEVPGLGPKTLATLHKKLSIDSLEDLNRAINSGALQKLPGFGEKKIENMRRGITLWLSGKRRMPLSLALAIAESLLEKVRKLSSVERADVAGSIRRRRDTIGDLDLLLISADNPLALREFSRLPVVKQIIALGDTRATVIIEDGVQVDVRAVEKNTYGAALLYFTGSKEHNVHLRTIARGRGLKISEYGVFRGAKRIGGEEEKDVYAALKMPVIPPELREDRGEIAAALEGRLPKLIDIDDLRGDLHAHTNYSDGRSTIEEMVERAARLGYEYIALADHSPAARVARGLDTERLEQKIEELDAVRKKWRGRKPHILLGAEVDILSNGQLDYPDKVLARFDVVTASVHASFKQSKDRMTGRLLDAISNPHVHIIGHPTTRLLGSRDAVEFDLVRIVEAAAGAGVALEVNGSPYRLDLTDTMARAAQDGGALLAINSDAHSAAQLEQIRYGVFQARRGWIEARTVVNTWNMTKLTAWLSKRRRTILVGRAKSRQASAAENRTQTL
jgi:DNA polymerase (family 10)